MNNRFSQILSMLVLMGASAPAGASTVLFDFNSGPIHAPITSLFPLDLRVDGINARLPATGQGFSIQDTQQVILPLPTGFSGLGIAPASVFPADLLVSYPNEKVTDFSIMVAPQELNTDSTATMRVTAYCRVFCGVRAAISAK